jgi:hypothetical protein
MKGTPTTSSVWKDAHLQQDLPKDPATPATCHCHLPLPVKRMQQPTNVPVVLTCGLSERTTATLW